jgi:hypothetical protein
MKSAAIVFVVSQLVVAVVFQLLWFSDDVRPIDWVIVNEQNSWMLLVWAQVLAVVAGLWEGIAGVPGRRRLIVCAAVPVGLVAWYMLGTFLYPGAPGVWKTLVLLPAISGTTGLFAPSWGAVAAGAFVGRRFRTPPLPRT